MPVLDQSQLILDKKHLQILKALLCEHVPQCEVWAYGSRVLGGCHDGSDLDLVLRDVDHSKCDIRQWSQLLNAIQDSTLPFIVDVHLWSQLPERFHDEIQKRYVILQSIANK